VYPTILYVMIFNMSIKDIQIIPIQLPDCTGIEKAESEFLSGWKRARRETSLFATLSQ
jgi:hypothetical protein